MKIKVHPETYAVLESSKNIKGAFATINYDGKTIIIGESKIKNKILRDGDWKMITFDADFSFNVVGFIAKVSNILAKASIPIFVISSYHTDHILIKKKYLDKARSLLEKLEWNRYTTKSS
jgi:uncharacterized protein